jgi:heterodisulfide reductase subunit D
VQLAKALRRGLIDYNPDLIDELYKCTTCGACQEFCSDPYLRSDEKGIMPILETMRANMVTRGYGPLPSQLAIKERIEQEHNPYGEPHSQRDSWKRNIMGTDSSGAGVGYFVGCTAAYRQQQMAQSTVKLISMAGEELQLLGTDEWCCGSPLIRTGQIEDIEKLAKNNVEAIRDRGITDLVVSCAGCYATLSRDYPRILGEDLGFNVLYVTEYVARLISEDKLSMPKSKETVTYHDPCHVRHFWKYDAPREVINSIRGINFVEMKRNRDESFCCGAGGGTKIGYPEWALACSIERIQEARDTGANVLLTNCPFCVSNLSEAANEMITSMRVMDLNHYVLELAGEKLDTPIAKRDITDKPKKSRWFKSDTEKPVKDKSKNEETGDNEYRCEVCGFTTSDKLEMATHMLEHTSKD